MLGIGSVVTETIARDSMYEHITSIEHTSITLYLDRKNNPPIFFVVHNNIVVATILAQSTENYISDIGTTLKPVR